MGHKYNRSSKDANHKDIVKALRAAGAYVIDTTPVKHAFDMIVIYRGKVFIIEIKNPDKLPKEYDRERLESMLSDGEKECMAEVEKRGVTYYIVATVDEAIKVISESTG